MLCGDLGTGCWLAVEPRDARARVPQSIQKSWTPEIVFVMLRQQHLAYGLVRLPVAWNAWCVMLATHGISVAVYGYALCMGCVLDRRHLLRRPAG